MNADVPDYLRGRKIVDVAADLSSGILSPSQLPVGVFAFNDKLVAVNNRTLAALSLAGMKPTVLYPSLPTTKILNRLNENSPYREVGVLPSRTVAVTEGKKNPKLVAPYFITVPH